MFLVASDGRTDVGCDYMCIGMAAGSASFFHGTLRSLLPFLLLDFRATKLSESEGWTLPSLSCVGYLRAVGPAMPLGCCASVNREELKGAG